MFYKRLINSDWYLDNLAITHIGTIFRIKPLITYRYEDNAIRIADEWQLMPETVSPLDVIRIPKYFYGYPDIPSIELRIIPLMIQYFFGRVFKNKVMEDFVVTNANAISFGEMISMTSIIDDTPGAYFNAGCY